MATIRLDYDNVCREVNRLKRVATECHELYYDSQKALADLNVYWEGAAANEFLHANTKWQKEIQSIRLEIEELAQNIQRIADEIRDAERRAAQAIAGGGSGGGGRFT